MDERKNQEMTTKQKKLSGGAIMGDLLNKRTLMGAVCAFAMTAGEGTLAWAQEANPAEPTSTRGDDDTGGAAVRFMNPVTVTARKTEENLQDVPIAVTAFSGEQLQALGANESGDVALYTPNFTWNTEFGRATPQPFLRGVGSNGFMPNNVNPIAVYSDHALIGPNVAQGFAAFDVDRVEVLKGPQGTLYGRNSTGGLINFISVKPTIGDGVSGFAQVETGDFGTFNTEVAAEADLGDMVAARLSFASNRNTGLFENPNLGENSGTTDDIAARLQVLIEPSDRLRVLINGHYGQADPDVSPFKAIGTICPAGVTIPNLRDCIAGGGADSTDLFVVNSGFTSEKVDSAGGLVNIEYDISDNLQLTSITAYDSAELNRVDDVDDLPVFQENDRFWDEFDTYSQELRLSGTGDRTNWHIGGYYYNEQYNGEFLGDFVAASVFNIKEITTESFSLFGQVDHDLTERLGLSVGLRYTNESKEIDVEAGLATGNLPQRIFGSLADTGATVLDSATATNDAAFDDISGRVSLDYKFSDDVMLYGSYARGFKAGDVNGLAFGLDNATFAADSAALDVQSQITDPETLDAYEVGFKSTLARGNLRLNGAAFYYIYEDQQQSVLLPVPGLTLPVTTFSNAAKSEIPGAELEAVWTPTDTWLLIANLGWVDAEYDEFISGSNDFSGNRMPLTSEYSATGLISKDFALGNGGYFNVQANARYQSEIFFQPTNDPVLASDEQTVFGARAAYSSPGDAWELSLNVDNLTDERYFVSGFDFNVPGVQSYHAKTNTPRLVTAKLRVNF